MNTLDVLKLIADEDFRLVIQNNKVELIKVSTNEYIFLKTYDQLRLMQESFDKFTDDIFTTLCLCSLVHMDCSVRQDLFYILKRNLQIV